MNVVIDELVVRVPSVSGADAQRIGAEVGQRVAHALAGRGVVSPDLGALDLQLTVPAGTGSDALIELVTDAIVRRLVVR